MAALSPDPAEAEKQDIQLLKDEAGGLMMEEGITTISFYKGDFQATTEALRAQFAQVVASNPWLAGRLVKAKGGASLRHPSSPSAAEIDALFTVTAAADTAAFKLAPTAPYTKICTDMYASKKVIVGSGFSLIGKDKPVAILTLAESAPGEFALIFSMSHAVGDGRTYYEILRMVQPGAAVRQLVSARVLSFSESIKDMCGRKQMAWVDSPPAICMMLPMMLFPKKPTCVAFHLDAEKLAAAKEMGASGGDVPYVTTNDILTSGFFNEVGARIGLMGIDARGKLEGIGHELAGNYVSALTMDTGAFATPAAVRKMMSSTPYETTLKPMPKCCSWFCGREKFNIAMCTNWSSFAGGLVQLEGCEMVVHLPVHNPASMAFDCMIPFSSGVGKVSVICWTVSSDEAGLRAALPVGECVSKVLFP